MSQSGSILTAGTPGSGFVETLTGNSGGAVGPNASNNINVVGDGTTVTVVGSPGSNTLTISALSEAQTFDGNTGSATPSAGVINLLGSGNITTAAAGNTVTYTLTGTTNHSLQLGNASGSLTSLGVAGNGQLPIGSIGANPVLATLTAGSGVTITNGAGSITISSPSAASAIQTISGDTGSVTGTTVSLKGNSTAGSSVSFIGSGSAMTFNVTDASNNTIIGKSAGNGSLSGTDNTGIGEGALLALTSGSSNTVLGFGAGIDLTSGGNNTFIGNDAGENVLTGANNIALGSSAGISYVAAESSNIVIGHIGVVAESNVLRIGTNGSSSGQQSSCYIAGIDGVNVGSVATVVTEASNQLGTAVITGGTGITVTPGANTITISASGTTNLAYTNVNSSPYSVNFAAPDEYLSVDSSGGPITLNFPNTATLGRTYIVKDRTGSAATNNITLTTPGGTVTFDGSTSFVMNTNFEAVNIMGNGSNYEIF